MFSRLLDSLIDSMPTLIGVLAAWTSIRSSQRGLHRDMNSRLDQLVAAARKEGLVKGRQDERDAQRNRP